MNDIEASAFKAAWDSATSPGVAASRLGLTLDDTLWWEWHFREREGVQLKSFPPPSDSERVRLSATEAAEALGLSHKRVIRLLGEGELQGGNEKRTYFIYADSVEGYKRRHSDRLILKIVNPQPAMPHAAVESFYRLIKRMMESDPVHMEKRFEQDGVQDDKLPGLTTAARWFCEALDDPGCLNPRIRAIGRELARLTHSTGSEVKPWMWSFRREVEKLMESVRARLVEQEVILQGTKLPEAVREATERSLAIWTEAR